LKPASLCFNNFLGRPPTSAIRFAEGGNMAFFETAKTWLRQLTEVGLLLVALGIVLQLLFGKAVAFLTGDIVNNLIVLIKALGDQGVVGLIALAIILWLFAKRSPG